MTATEAVQAATNVVRSNALTIAQILAHQSALMDLPTFFKAAGIAESTGYQIAAKGELPIEVIRFARRRYVRTLDAWRFLGLINQENDGSAGAVTPALPVEPISSTSTTQ
jgi:hypothetical protein